MNCDEIVLILSSLELIVYNEQQQPKINVNDVTKKNFNMLFGANSSVCDKFMCDKCKQSQIKIESESTKQINEQKARIAELERQLEENIRTIQELTDETDKPNDISMFNDDNENDGTPSRTAAMSKKMMNNIRKLLSTDIERISEHMTNECEKVKQQGKKVLNAIESMKNDVMGEKQTSGPIIHFNEKLQIKKS